MALDPDRARDLAGTELGLDADTLMESELRTAHVRVCVAEMVRF